MSGAVTESRPAAAEQPVTASAGATSEPIADLSIIIVSYNTREVLGDCLRSIARNLDSALPVEVIVVDNASRDGSAAMVAERFPWVILVVSPRNVGFAAGNNLGLARARGRYVLLLNSDTIVHRGAFRALVDFLDANPQAAAVSPRLLETDGSLQPSVRAFPSPRALLYQYTAFRLWRPWKRDYQAYKARDFDYRKAARVDVAMGAALCVRRDLLLELGGLDAGYFMYFEEAHLCRQIRARGLEVRYDPVPRITHLGGESSAPEKAMLFRVYLASMMRYLDGDLVGWRRRAFRLIFKSAFIARQLGELPFLGFQVWRFWRWQPDPARRTKKIAEMARILRFFVRDLPWFIARL